MIVLDSETVVVFDTDDLRDAVSTDNGYLLVYFGADITLAYGVTIYPGKPSLTFDGTYNGVTYTFTDMDNSSATNTIGVRAESNIVITFKNINLIGRNYYGIPYVPNGANFDSISTIYENVTYTGTQINHNPYGYTRFTDCNITVNNHEAAEAREIEIGGTTRIEKTNSSNAIFWIRGNNSLMPFIKILSGANVTIDTENYFLYEYYPPDFIIESGASLTMNTNSGFGNDNGHTLNSFLVDENASFRYTQAVSGGGSSLCIDGPLTVNDGASFYMQADFPNTNRLIRFYGSSAGLFINNPKSFVLYNRGNSNATAFQFSSTIPILLNGGQVNYWESAALFPSAGTFEDHPMRKWNRPDYEPFTLEGTTNSTATNITFNDFTPEELAELPSLEDLRLYRAAVLSIGRIPLEVYSTVITRSVTGATEPFANIKITLYPSYYEDPHTVTADDTGIFTLVPTSPMPFSDFVEVFSNTPFLIVSVIGAVLAEDELYIESSPIQISFPAKPMPGFPDVILPRDSDNTDSAVVIVDTRAGHPEWQLWVKITGPLMTDENDILPDAVVFGFENHELETVQTEFMAILTGQHPELQDRLTVTWPADEGVLARITAPIRSGKRYTTQFGWSVTPEGESPEEEQ